MCRAARTYDVNRKDLSLNKKKKNVKHVIKGIRNRCGFFYPLANAWGIQTNISKAWGYKQKYPLIKYMHCRESGAIYIHHQYLFIDGNKPNEYDI